MKQQFYYFHLKSWLFCLALLGIVCCILGVTVTDDRIAGLLSNFGTGLIGSIVTFLFIERLVARQASEQELINQLLDRLRLANAPKPTRQLAATELLERRVFRNRDLRGLDFSGLSLPGAEFYYCNLDRSSFFGADLSGANFCWCSVSRANFRGALLGDVKSEGVNWEEADTTGAMREAHSD